MNWEVIDFVVRLICAGTWLFWALLGLGFVWWFWYAAKSSWSYTSPERKKLLVESLLKGDWRDIDEIEEELERSK